MTTNRKYLFGKDLQFTVVAVSYLGEVVECALIAEVGDDYMVKPLDSVHFHKSIGRNSDKNFLCNWWQVKKADVQCVRAPVQENPKNTELKVFDGMCLRKNVRSELRLELGNIEQGVAKVESNNKDADLVQALKALATFPLEDVWYRKGKTYQEAPDNEAVFNSSAHKLTVGDVKAARRVLDALKKKFKCVMCENVSEIDTTSTSAAAVECQYCGTIGHFEPVVKE